jgi:eukaryotic-like serine/threonine-protein kinase
MDDRRSDRFGRYEILGELGRGAMGIVYKARDPKINRVVAVKTISLAGQEPEEEREYRERFYREAEAAGRLSHPGIVTIFDVGEEPDTRSPYIVMEFVGGPSLDKLLSGSDHKIPLDTALQLTLELADALDCAHGQGVVHRDLKPANILLTEDGHAKIADFGVAKLNLSNHTLGGRLLGTPAYMSPEQLDGEVVDGRSDVFSLGVILYTMLTGYRPFQGNSAATVSFKVVNRDPVPATVLDTDLPHGLDYIIGRAMAKDPAQRYQRGMEMVLDIQELREGREPWSKTKQPGSTSVTEAEQTTNTMVRSWAARQRAAAAKPGVLSLHGASEKVLNKLRQSSSAAAALFMVGLVVLAIGSSKVFWHQKPPLRRSAGTNAVKTMSSEGAPAMATAHTTASETLRTTPGTSPVTAAARSTPSETKPARRTMAKVSPSNVSSGNGSSARLDVEAEYNFTEAQLSVWIDDQQAYAHPLEGTDKKRLVVFHGVEGHQSHVIQLSPGEHRVRVRVVSGADSYDQSRTVEGEFASGKEKLLQIHFDKRGLMNVTLQDQTALDR